MERLKVFYIVTICLLTLVLIGVGYKTGHELYLRGKMDGLRICAEKIEARYIHSINKEEERMKKLIENLNVTVDDIEAVKEELTRIP